MGIEYVVKAELVRAIASMREVADWIAKGEDGDCGEGREM